MSAEYYVPYQDAETEFAEKRSRFLGRVWRVADEAEARRRIDETRKQYHDARHHCWCYVLKDGATRYSDDGEPQGTAGQPILNVFQRRNVVNVCCVVTRYFGGILLGAGGLTRAYSKAAKDTLDAAGIARVTRRTLCEINAPYALAEQIQREIRRAGGRVSGAEYGASVILRASFASGTADAFAERVREVSGGTVRVTPIGEEDSPGERLDL